MRRTCFLAGVVAVAWWFGMLVVAALAQATLSGCGIEGLHSANPTTSFRFDPWSRSVEFRDNKDNDISVDEITIDGEARTATVKNLRITNNASDVRIANRQQLEGLAIQAEAIGNAWAKGIQAGAQLATSLAPILGGLAPNPIWGTHQPGAAPPGWIYVGSTPATQPAETEGGLP